MTQNVSAQNNQVIVIDCHKEKNADYHTAAAEIAQIKIEKIWAKAAKYTSEDIETHFGKERIGISGMSEVRYCTPEDALGFLFPGYDHNLMQGYISPTLSCTGEVVEPRLVVVSNFSRIGVFGQGLMDWIKNISAIVAPERHSAISMVSASQFLANARKNFMGVSPLALFEASLHDRDFERSAMDAIVYGVSSPPVVAGGKLKNRSLYALAKK